MGLRRGRERERKRGEKEREGDIGREREKGGKRGRLIEGERGGERE